jgi:hypothetical protein
MTTDIILNHIRQLGWTVSIQKVNGTVEMHAVHAAGEQAPEVARCNDGDGLEEEYRCACLLARAVGLRWPMGSSG